MSRFSCCAPSVLRSAEEERRSPSGISDISSVLPTTQRYTFRVLGRAFPAGQDGCFMAMQPMPTSGLGAPRQAQTAFRTAECRCPGFRLNAVCMAGTPCVRVNRAAGCTAQATWNRARRPGQGLFLYHLLTGKMLRGNALKRMLHPPAARAGARCSCGLYPFPAVAPRVACRLTRCGLTPASIPRRSLLIPDLC